MKKKILAFLLAMSVVVPGILSEMTVHAVSNFTPEVVGTQTNDIEVHLFNYGNQINSLGGYTNMHFRTETNSVEFDAIAEEPHVIGWQTYALMSDLVNGYPSTTTWWQETEGPGRRPLPGCGHTGSWKYLFDKDIAPETSYTALSTSNYAIKHYPITNLRLFTYDSESGYYSYDSKYNAAVYNHTDKSLTAYNYALRPTTIKSFALSQGSFLPFNEKVTSSSTNVTRLTHSDGSKAYDTNPGNGVAAMNSSYYYDEYSPTKPFSGYLIESNAPGNLFALNSGHKADEAFGMSVEFEFMMPADGSGQWKGSDMIYEFQGDDDMVVYVDDKPVLNLVGHHPAVKGTINFRTGDVVIYQDGKPYEVSWYRSEQSTNGGSLDLDPDMESSSLFGSDWKTNEFKAKSMHTLKIFYMERVGGASNCHMKFNLPVMPKGNMSVTKIEEGLNEKYAGTTEYDFQLLNEDNSPRANEKYTVIDVNTSNVVSTGTTDANGGFKLLHNQKAIFSDMDEDTPVKVKEVVGEEPPYTTKYSVNGGNATNGTITGVLSIKQQFPEITFTNTWKTKDIKIKKVVVDEENLINGDPDYEFALKINGEAYTGTATGATMNNTGKFTLKDGGTTTIKNIPVGWEYTIAETEPALGNIKTYKYELPTFSGKTGPFEFGKAYKYTVSNGTNEVTVTNTVSATQKKLTVKKVVEGTEGDKTKPFEFTLQLKENGSAYTKDISYKKSDASIGTLKASNGKYTFTLKHNESYEFTLPKDCNYTVTEKSYATEGYTTYINDVKTSTAAGTLTNDASVTVKNEFTAKDVTIEKQVTGNLGDQDKGFTFKATLTMDGKALNIPAQKNSKIKIDSTNKNVATFTLAHGEKVTFENIPCGAKLVVEETSIDGYKVTIKQGETTIGENGKVTFNNITENIHIVYTNHKAGFIDTGLDDLTASGRMMLCFLVALAAVFAEVVLFKTYRRRRIR